MPVDAAYSPLEMLYQSVGLTARAIADQAPPHSYLNLLNCLERAENIMSSRYGFTIINRDPDGTPSGQNYLFPTAVSSLSRLTYLGQSYRYAGLEGGDLYRRVGDTQGPYDRIQTGLSGHRFQSVITNCFLSSQPYNFIYDSNMSIKDNGLLSIPQLTGIDPSPYTLNTQPYSPLLTLIDNFAAANSYASAGFSSGWAFTPVITLTATSSDIVTDFPEFFGVQQAGSGSYALGVGSTTASVTGVGSSSNANTFFGFPSVPIVGSEVVSFSILLNGTVSNGLHATGSGDINLLYSADGGASFTSFFSQSAAPGTTGIGGLLTITIPGLTNLNQLQIQAQASVTTMAGSTFTTVTTAALSGAISIVASPDVFGPVANGMLALLGTTPSTSIAISNVISSDYIDGTYDQLLITTQSAHGRSAGNAISIYASSNDLVDGFYTVLAAPTATTLTVSYTSNVALSSTGGTLWGGAPQPATCVITGEYSTPYPTQMSAWGFYQQVPLATTSFPVSSFQGSVTASTTATVGATVALNLAQNNQVNDDDLIVITLNVGNPAAITNIRLQFDVNSSNYSSSYYYKDISPSYYQANIQQTESAYDATTQQIFADTISLITGQPPNSTAAQLQPANLSTGQNAWIAIYMRRGDFIAVGQAGQSGADWTAITGWQLVITTNAVGSSTVAANGLYLQWGYGPSSFGGVGYDYRQTYYNAATGTESNGCPTQRFDKQFGYLSSLIAPTYLRQASRVTGAYSVDTQITHIRIYRRGGIYSASWFLLDQFPNIARIGGEFVYKDVIPDSVLSQAAPLVLDNDPPVTSSLQNPIATTLSAATSPGGISIYSTYAPQTITVAQSTAVFVVDQVVDIGFATTLEQVRVITGGVGTFTTILRLQHNAGEPVNVYSIPRAKCNLCALAYDQVWLAGDSNNPNYLYYSKRGRPENFGPQNYIKVGVSGDTIMAIVNWRGTLFVATNKTWFSIIGGAQPYPQPSGSAHGVIATGGWTQSESAIFFRSNDGWRAFTGANGEYMTLPVELIFRPNPTPPLTPVPLADSNSMNDDIMAFYNNSIYDSYVSTTSEDERFRLVYDSNYRRYRYDDLAATAMLWEQDTNTFLIGIAIADGQYAVAQDQVNDYDDGGWVDGELVQTPIDLTVQTPFNDQGKPHYPKQYNMLESDVNTMSQAMQTILMFNTEPPTSLALPSYTGNNLRNKKQFQITPTSPAGSPVASGVQAYSMSLIHTMSVTVAPTFYQENIYAAMLADYRNSFDTFWLKLGTDESKIIKQGYFDVTSTQTVTISLYADGNSIPYFVFTLPPEPTRLTIRRLFPAWKPRLWRLIAISNGDFQFWSAPRVEFKTIREGSTYSITDLGSQ